MNCAQTQNLLHAFLDGELDVVRHLELEHHLADCSVCSSLHDNQQNLRTALKRTSLYYRAPEGLRQRLQESRDSTPVPSPPRPGIRTRRVVAALAASVLVVAAVLGFSARGTLWPAPPEDHLAGELVANHVRSLQAEHLTDVASEDRHTVKPWFKGRLDFAPPVHDWKAKNFVLVGGRLDYLEDRPVAALVYRRREHVINVFVWPARLPALRPLELTQRQGYQVAAWGQGGMNYAIISDLNAAEVRELIQLIQQQETDH